MRISSKIAATIAMAGALLAGPAFSHSFNVMLVVPLSGEQEEAGAQFRNGFMLATTERDAHANQESDGHLGGLDVYVSVLDLNEVADSDVSDFAAQNDINIVIATGDMATISKTRALLAAQGVGLLITGVAPQVNSEMAVVAAFRANFERAYGAVPVAEAVQGYNAAQRIEIAVRSQAGVGDGEALALSFEETAGGFEW